MLYFAIFSFLLRRLRYPGVKGKGQILDNNFLFQKPIYTNHPTKYQCHSSQREKEGGRKNVHEIHSHRIFNPHSVHCTASVNNLPFRTSTWRDRVPTRPSTTKTTPKNMNGTEAKYPHVYWCIWRAPCLKCGRSPFKIVKGSIVQCWELWAQGNAANQSLDWIYPIHRWTTIPFKCWPTFPIYKIWIYHKQTSTTVPCNGWWRVLSEPFDF